jgi:hypothetical protein
MPGTNPDKKELARMKVMADLGVSASAIGKRLGRSHNTVIKYLRSEVYNYFAQRRKGDGRRSVIPSECEGSKKDFSLRSK